MALKIATINRKPGLIWRGPLSDRPQGWLPLLRRLQAHYQIGIESEQTLSTIPGDLAALVGRRPTDVTVTLDLTGPGRSRVPEQGHWVHLPAWDFSSLPEVWDSPLRNGADGLVVGSEAQYDGFLQDKLAAERMMALPNGVDLTVMTPEGESRQPEGTKARRFVFVGDMTWNSGVETLLKAYGDEFMSADDVSLVLLDLDAASPDNRRQQLRLLGDLQAQADAPHVVRQTLPADAEARAAMLRGADALIYLARDAAHPWPVIEAMACGVPVIVPAGGPARAVAPASCSWQASGKVTRHSDPEIGGIRTLGLPQFYEVEPADLRRQLRHVYEHADDVAARREAARAAAEPYGWDAIAERMKAFLDQILAGPLVRDRVKALHGAFNAANEAFIKQDYAESRHLLEPFLDLDPPSPDFYATYGTSLLFTGSPSRAIKALVRAIELRDNSANYFNLIGVALFQLHEYPLARRFFKAALVLQPGHQGASESLVEAERKLQGKSAKVRNRVTKPYQYLEGLLARWENTEAKPMRLSVSMIVKNEEKFLAQCLASIKDFADEIVVVDTGSTDRTVEIAESFGAILGHFEWTGDFADARNAALDLCTGDWILALDADEELAPGCGDNLRQLINRPTSRQTIYLPRIINLVNGSDADAIEHYGPRLFPRHPHLRWRGRIHEQVLNVVDGDGATDRARVPDVTLHHHGYSPEVMAERGKEARNMVLLEQSLKEDPDNPFHHFNMGVALRVGDKLHESIPYFRKAIDLCHAKGQTPMYLASSYNYLIASLVSGGRTQEALDLAAKCEMYCQDQPDYWLNLGIANDRLGRHHEAIAAYQRLLDLRGSSAPILADRGAMTWKPYAGIGSAYMKLGDVEKGERYLRMALKENPKNVELRKMLLSNAIQRREYDRVETDLRAFLEEIEGPERRTVYQDLANLYLQQDRKDEAVKLLAEAFEGAAPGEEFAGAVSDLARVYQLTGQDDKALALMKEHQLTDGVFEALGQTYCANEDWEALASLCERLLANGMGEAFAYAHRGIVRYKQGQTAVAEADFRRATELNPEDAESWSNLGVVALAQEQVDEAEGYYRQALGRQPDLFAANLDLAKIALHREQPQEAYPYLQKALEVIPTDAGALSLAAETAMALDDLDGAEQHLHGLIAAEPAESNHWVRLGYHYLNTGEAQAALRVLGEALEMTKESPNPAVYSALGVTLLELGKFEDSRNAFILAVHLSPDDAQAIQGLQIADKLCMAAT